MIEAVALMSAFGLGMCFVLLGSIGIKLMPRLNIDQGKFGSLISMFFFTCVIASVIMGMIVDKVGYQPVAIFGFVSTAACIFMFARGKTYMMVAIPCLLLGFGAMALSMIGNVMGMAVLFDGEKPAEANNLVNVFFGLGLFVTPMLISFLLRKTSYENAVSALGVIVLLPAIIAIFGTYPEIVGSNAFSIGNAFGLLAEPVVLIAALALFCYISLESTFCNWLTPYSKEIITRDCPEMELEAVDSSSQRKLAVFAVAMMIGRFAASQMSGITAYGGWLIAVAAAISAVVIIAMTKGKAQWTNQLAFAAGLVFAPIFPTIVGVTASKHPHNFGTVMGIIFAIGLLGAVLVPKIIGNMAKDSSIQKCLKLLLPFCAALVVLALILGGLAAVVAE